MAQMGNIYRFNNLSEIDTYRNTLKKQIDIYEKNIIYDYNKIRKNWSTPLSIFSFMPKFLKRNVGLWGAFVSGFSLIRQLNRKLKKSSKLLSVSVLLLLSLVGCSSKIENSSADKAIISLSFSSENIVSICDYIEALPTKADNLFTLPDTNNFHLIIRENSGDNIIYNGSYGNRPQQLMVEPGNYTISTYSQPFIQPDFDIPQFGDTQNISLSLGQVANVEFNCTQLNSGLRLIFDSSFTQRYNGGHIKIASVVSSTSDTLNYLFDNNAQYAFFFPGPIRLFVAKDNQRTLLTSFNLEAAEMQTINLKALAINDHFSIAVDTTRIWRSEEFILGVTPNGSSATLAIGTNKISDFMECNDIWVEGYVVGTFKTGGNFIPFVAGDENISETNIALSYNPNAQSAEDCVSAELSKSSVRAALNLKSNPTNYKKKIRIKGEVKTYMGVTGIGSVSEFEIE